MDAESWRKLEELFELARNLEPAERQALVDRECSDDVELRKTLDKMLRAAAEDASMLEPAPEIRNILNQYMAGLPAQGSETAHNRKVDTSQTTASQETGPEGTNSLAVGSSMSTGVRFQVLHHHAKGGQGEVFLAHDHELHRQVALKQLQTRFADDSDSRTRFLMEAEITGGLEHPGIIPVYSLGASDDGRPFYAMRFVRGNSLKDSIAQFHKADGPKRDPSERSLALRRLLGRFIDVCDAVRYAHSRGVLHRDLKPGNIMLGKYGETLVVDWGLAKAVGKSDERDATSEVTMRPSSGSGHTPTLLGSVMGTPAYMSPEQAEGRLEELGPASDVYSLGATLYCLLTGRPPFTSEELERCRASTDDRRFCSPWSKGISPPKPCQVKPQVPASLEAICLKATAFDPQDRYESPGALAEDVEHWLADEPVSAYRESFSERLSRWSRRHRAWIQAGAAISAVVLVAAVVSFVFYTRAMERKRLAVRTFQLARDAVDTWMTGPAEDLRYYPDAQEFRLQILQKAAEYYTKLAEESDDVALESEQGRTWQRIGDIYWTLGNAEESRRAYETAESILSEVTRRHPTAAEPRLELANTRTKIAIALLEMADESTEQREEADMLLASAIEGLRLLKEEDPNTPSIREALGTALLNWGLLLDTDEAVKTLRESVLEFEWACWASSDRPEYVQGLSDAKCALGRVLLDANELEDAEDSFGRAVDTLNRIIKPDRPDYRESRAAAASWLAIVLGLTGRYAEEIDAYDKAVADYGYLCEFVPRTRESLAQVRTNRARALYKQGKTEAAKAELTEAWGVLTDPIAVATCRDDLALVLSDLGELDRARDECEKSIDALTGLAKGSPDDLELKVRVAICRSHLGQIFQKLDLRDDAKTCYEEAIKVLKRLVDERVEYRDTYAHVCKHFGTFLWTVDCRVDGSQYLEMARNTWEQLVTGDATPEHLHNLAGFYVSCVDPELRDPESAIEYAKRAHDMAQRNADYVCTLGAAHYRAGNWPESVEFLNKATELRRPDRHCRDSFFLAMARWQEGKSEQARRDYKDGCEWMSKNLPHNLELNQVRQEAADLLDIPEQREDIDNNQPQE